MTPVEWMALISVFFLTSTVSVVTGSTSLITVPVMLQFGIEPRVAVATNMLALLCMSIGGSLAFRGRGAIDRTRLPWLIALTLAGSIVGAMLLLVVPPQVMPPVIAVSMVAVAVFSVFQRGASAAGISHQVSRGMGLAGYAATFILGVYGGFFSGGYVTLLTAAFVALFGMTFVQAVSTTKVANVFSSSIAVGVFMWRGLVDYRMGIILGVVMFLGALVGGRVAVRLPDLWLRRVFLTAVLALALKMLLYDVLWKLLICSSDSLC